MSTATAVPTAPLISTEKFDIAYGLKTLTSEKAVDKEKNPLGILHDDNHNPKKEATILRYDTQEHKDEVEKMSDIGLFEGTTITVTCDYPATNWDALVAFRNREWKNDDGSVRDQSDVDSEIVKLFNNGASGKVMNRLRAIATKQDEKGNFTLTGDVVDLTSEITSGSKRVFLTEEQKTWKGLANLPAAVREQVWRAYLSATNKEFYLPAE